MKAEEIFKKWGNNVSAYPAEALRDFDIGMKIVERNAYDVRYLAPELKDNYEIAKKTVSTLGDALGYLPDKWKDNEEIVRIAVTENPQQFYTPLKHASDRLKDNEELALLAVSADGNNFAYVSDRLKDNEKVVDAAVANNPYSLSFASDRIKHIEKYALLLFEQEQINSVNARYGFSKNIDIRHLSDKSLMKKATSKNHNLIQFITSDIQGYREVLKELSKTDSILFWVTDKKILDDKELVCLSLEHNGNDLSCVSERLRDDKDVVLTAVKNNGLALIDASKRLKNDVEVADVAILSDRRAVAYVGQDIKHLYKNDDELEL